MTFDMAAFLATLTPDVTPGRGRPLVVRAEEFQPLPAGQVHNPTHLSVAGDLPTATFEIFRQEIPAGLSSDMQRHHHETVHYVVSGRGHTDLEDESVTWETGSCVYTPPWTWHRHFNDSEDDGVTFLTIENSRLLGALGVGRRQSAGLVTVEQARAAFDQQEDHRG